MNGKLRRHLSYFWWAYAVSGVLVVLLWTTVFAKLAEPKDFEQLQITCVGGFFDCAGLQEELAEILPGRTEQALKRVTVEAPPVYGPYDLDTLLRARLSGGCDFFLISSSALAEYGLHLPSYFAPLPEDWLETNFPGAETVQAEGKSCGLRLSGGTRLADFCLDEEGCCVFFSANSVNPGDRGGGTAGQDAALQAVRYLMEGRDV